MLLHYGMDPGCCAAPLLLRLSLPPCEALDAEPSLLGLRSCPSSTLPSRGWPGGRQVVRGVGRVLLLAAHLGLDLALEPAAAPRAPPPAPPLAPPSPL